MNTLGAFSSKDASVGVAVTRELSESNTLVVKLDARTVDYPARATLQHLRNPHRTREWLLAEFLYVSDDFCAHKPRSNA